MVAAHRIYYQEEIESMIRLMKIEGGSLDDCEAELRLLADFVRFQADNLRDAWRDLLKGTFHEIGEQGLDPDAVWRQLRKRGP
jgi:hypothetical protein